MSHFTRPYITHRLIASISEVNFNLTARKGTSFTCMYKKENKPLGAKQYRNIYMHIGISLDLYRKVPPIICYATSNVGQCWKLFHLHLRFSSCLLVCFAYCI